MLLKQNAMHVFEILKQSILQNTEEKNISMYLKTRIINKTWCYRYSILFLCLKYFQVLTICLVKNIPKLYKIIGYIQLK